MSFKVILVNPNLKGNYRKAKIITCNLGIAYLSAYLKKHVGCEVYIIDARAYSYSPKEVAVKINQIKPDLVGFSLCVEQACYWTNQVIKKIKEKNCKIHVTLGNYFPSLYVTKAFEKIYQIDSIILGEGEVTLGNLVKSLINKENWQRNSGIAYRENNEIKVNSYSELVCDLDQLPFPDRYLVENDDDDFEVMIEGTRGCLFACSFCAVSPFYKLSYGKKFRLRSANHILEEIKFLKQKYPNLRSFRFVDSEFVAINTEERAIKFAKLLIMSGLDIDIMMDARASSIIKYKDVFKLLKKAGLKRLYIGIESGSDRILKLMNKGIDIQKVLEAMNFLKDIDLDYSYGFMMITPWAEEEDIIRNRDLLKKVGRIEFRSLYHELTLIPKTKAFEVLNKSKKLKWDGNLYYYTYKTSSKRIETFRKIFKDLLEKESLYFGHIPGYIYESIRQLRRNGKQKKAQTIESLSDKLFIEIFDYIWNESRFNKKDNDLIVKNSLSQIKPVFNNILKQLDPMLDPSSCKNRLPNYVPKKQI